ncbi:MAG: DEAD/DEAH box helicase family protein [Gammaproteobacteria bacterium]
MSGAKSAKAPAPRVKAGKANKAKPMPFSYKLVLNQWLLSLFQVTKFEELAQHLRHEGLEGLDANNIHHFHHALTAHLFNLTQLSTQQLFEYDQNIVRHTQRLNERRLTRGEEPIVWKYFQYLSLLFTEIYLDRYFRDAAGLLATLNAQIALYNDGKPVADQLVPLDAGAEAWSQLNKLAFWMATGSGKTLLMHANILQYRHYLAQHGKSRELNRILLLTPNEGLSQQHLREFAAGGIEAELFNKDARGLFSGHAVEILEVTRLRDEMGERTVAIEAFEGNNLVLVDEGHRGAAGGREGAWMKARERLCENGFSFEYSATFGQAVKGDPALTNTYARSILMDYSYRYFYGDGFGKDYQILNIDDATQNEQLDRYLVACLLSFYQQQRLYREQQAAMRPFNIEKPLWIFVGGRVTASLNAQDASDIVAILRFLDAFVSSRATSIQHIDAMLKQGLVTADGRNVFDRRFGYLNSSGALAAQLFDDILATLFNAPGGGRLHIENLKGATGEVALRVGAENEPFGVINVGDDAKLVKICHEEKLETGEREFSGSLFHRINEPDSSINLLIGSKKFTEGWSSWRVSTMGLMNVGQGEGAQIIQLFGRGVRLKGYELSLKRSNQCNLPVSVARPKEIHTLETLGIFGIRANYMAEFRKYLEEEGLPGNEERAEFFLPVVRNLGTQKLKMIRLKKVINGVSTEFGDAFRKLAPIPTLQVPEIGKVPQAERLLRNRIVLNWYPKIQALQARNLAGGDGDGTLNQTVLTQRHIAFLDIDQLYFDLERFKAERGWYNLNLTRANIAALLADQNWYWLQIPEDQLRGDSFERVRVWQEIALALLKKYTERYYSHCKQAWELPHLEYRELDESDPNFLGVRENAEQAEYRVLYEKSRDDIATKLQELKGLIESGTLSSWDFQGLTALSFGQHLYQPLLYLQSKIVEISPVPLNKGEYLFVKDLKAFHEQNKDYFKHRQLYLLRNLSKGRGVGFFEAGNFHPDFILWLLENGKQRVIFVDPKGIHNLGKDDPKIRFHESIKEIEMRLADPEVHLDSFIVSNTPAKAMEMQWSMTKQDMRDRHILFQLDDADSYVGQLLGE